MSDESISGGSPYKGLIPYSEKDAPLFFGRDRERENIISNLMGSRLTILYGPTGAGKSSVLRAGVAHHLHLLAVDNLQKYGAPELAAVVFNKWRGDPLLNLQESIRDSVTRVLKPGLQLTEVSPTDLCLALEEYSKSVRGDLLIILDQFEEYFLYHGLSRAGTNFSKEFARAVNNSKLRVGFLISIREDALAKLDYFKGKVPELFSNRLQIEHLTTEAARDAIRKPLKVYSELSEAETEFTIDDQLVDEVCKQVSVGQVVRDTAYEAVGDDPDATHVETSFLQLVMSRLWEYALDRGSHRLRYSYLDKLGGATDIVRSHLDLNLTGYPEEEQETADAIFHYLVTPSGTKIAYTASDLAQLTRRDEKAVESVLEKLCAADTRILRSYYADRHQRGEDEKHYEIYHDVLASAILEWSAWYKKDKERIRTDEENRKKKEEEFARQQAIEEAEKEKFKQEQQRDQLRARRKQRQLVRILMASFLVTAAMVFLYFYALAQTRKAEEAARDAERQRVETQAALDNVNALDRALPFFKAVMRGHLAPVTAVDFSTDQRTLATASLDHTARLWDVATGKVIRILQGHSAGVRSVAFSPNGSLIVTASDDKTARVWDAATGESLHTLEGHTGEVTSARFSPDSKLIVTAGNDHTARVWDADTGLSKAVLEGHSGPVTYATFSPTRPSVVTTSTDGTARIWDLDTGGRVELVGHKSIVNMASFSPKGDYVVTASSDGEARLWSVDGRGSFVLKGHLGAVNSAEFSPDGTHIVTASDDKTARVWDIRTSQRPSIELMGHTGKVQSARFSPDSTRVVTASSDNTARVWDAESGKVLFELRGHNNAVTSAIFSSKGEFAATASQDNTARAWDITGAGGIQVTKVTIAAQPDLYFGRCPVTVTVTAEITAIGSGTIKYRLGRRGMPEEQERELEFESSDTKEVIIYGRFGSKANPTASGSYYLDVISPQPFPSAKDATYSIRCQQPPKANGPKPEDTPAQPTTQQPQ